MEPKDKELEIAEALDRLWKNEDFKVLQSFIDNRIDELRDEIEISSEGMSDVSVKVRLGVIGFLREYFNKIFPLWKDHWKSRLKDSQLEESDGPIV